MMPKHYRHDRKMSFRVGVQHAEPLQFIKEINRIFAGIFFFIKFVDIEKTNKYILSLII